MNKQEEKNQEYKKFASGLIVVRSNNSNFNADFSGTPRRLPDEEGTIYATDKALKYCIRKYLKDKGETVFVWRRRDKDDNPLDIDQGYKQVFKDEIKNKTPKKEIIKNLLTCRDVRLFGIAYAGAKKVAFTGPVQISYGLNKFYENVHYTNQILSPYKRRGEKKEQETMGEESKALESHYVYDFTVNPNHLSDAIEYFDEEAKNFSKLTQNDIQLFKEAARHGVSAVNSTTMIGSENELLLYIEYDEPLMLQNLKDFVKIEKGKDDLRRKVDLSLLKDYLVGNNGIFKNSQENSKPSIELYYDPNKTEVIGFDDLGDLNFKKYHIVTGQEL